jgi:uncharacterized membrane protein
MAPTHPDTVVCQICKQEKAQHDAMLGEAVRPSIVEAIRKQHPDWSPSGYICFTDLNQYLGEHVQTILEEEKGEITELEKDVIQAVKDRESLSVNENKAFDQSLTLGGRIADRMAEFGGSWTFIIIFGSVLMVWIAFNSIMILHRPFDPFPFILLNLVLSCLAAIQAPIIMMSQNRQESKDRLRAENDYRVNLKAEMEIRILGDKMDRLLSHQWQRLLDIQQVQTDLMEELLRLRPASKGDENEAPGPTSN